MIVADASWVIALRDPEDSHHADAAADNDPIGDDEEVLLHPVTLAECLIGPARLGVLDRATATLEEAFTIVEVDRRAPQRWARLRADTRLRLPDAIVLDTAIVHQARAVATLDGSLRAAAQAHGITD